MEICTGPRDQLDYLFKDLYKLMQSFFNLPYVYLTVEMKKGLTKFCSAIKYMHMSRNQQEHRRGSEITKGFSVRTVSFSALRLRT